MIFRGNVTIETKFIVSFRVRRHRFLYYQIFINNNITNFALVSTLFHIKSLNKTLTFLKGWAVLQCEEALTSTDDVNNQMKAEWFLTFFLIYFSSETLPASVCFTKKFFDYKIECTIIDRVLCNFHNLYSFIFLV